MALTKAQIRNMVRQMIDDPNAKRWLDTDLDQLIELVLDDLWTEILDVAPYLNSQYQQLTSLNAPGYIDLRQTIYGGNLTQRFYKLQQIISAGRHYFGKDPRDFLMMASQPTGDVSTISASGGTEQLGVFQFLGNQLWLHPLGTAPQFVEIRYNYKPVAFTSLTNGSIVDMPEGSYRAIVHLAAADALMKGNTEDANAMHAIGAQAKERLLSSIRRQYHGMTQPYTTQSAIEVGGI